MDVARFVKMLDRVARYDFASQPEAVNMAKQEFQQARRAKETAYAEDSDAKAKATTIDLEPKPQKPLVDPQSKASNLPKVIDFKPGDDGKTKVETVLASQEPDEFKSQIGAGLPMSKKQFSYMPVLSKAAIIARFRARVIAKVKRDLKWP